jgi:hypothetical protein
MNQIINQLLPGRQTLLTVLGNAKSNADGAFLIQRTFSKGINRSVD